MIARRDQPARAARGRHRSSRSTPTWTWRTRPAAATRRCSRSSASATRRPARRARRRRSSSPASRSTRTDHRGVAGNVTEFDGNLGLVIGAGGGSLTLFDAVRAHGGKPANYCEIGGNPSVAKACGLAKLVLRKARRRQDRGDDVDRLQHARGHRRPRRDQSLPRARHDPAEKIAIFRIPGAWEEEGFKILEKYGVDYADRSVSLQRGRQRGRGPRRYANEPRAGMAELSHPDRRGHDVHRPGHHRPRGGQPDARVPRLRRRRQGRRRRHPGPPGPRGPRRAGVRHRRPGGRAPRRADLRFGRHRAPRLHQGRRVRGDRERRSS